MSVQQLKVSRIALGAVSVALALGVCAPTVQAAPAAPAAPVHEQAVATVALHGVGGRVTAHNGQFVRERPTTTSRKIGTYRGGAIVRLSCKVRGQNVHGNALWYKLWNRSGWLSAKYVHNFGYVGWCARAGADEAGTAKPGKAQKPGDKQRPGTVQQPGVGQQPGAMQEPGAERQPGAMQEPGAERQPGAMQEPGAERQPGAMQEPAGPQAGQGPKG